MALWLNLLLLQPVLCIEIISFETSTKENISYWMIDKSIPFPAVFTICSLVKEDLIDGDSFFTIYGSSGNHWMTLKSYAYSQVELWLRINTAWEKIIALPPHLMNSWIHICIQADTITGNFSVLVNKEPPLFFNKVELTLQKPKNLNGKLFVGKSQDNIRGIRQYQGNVANFNIFSGSKNVMDMFESPCEHEGDIVNKYTPWRVVGGVVEKTEDSWMICNNYETYKVVIPTEITWNTARDICDKLGGGSIAELHTDRDSTHIVTLLENMNSGCKYLWTPLSDEEDEGEFRSSNAKQPATYLPWLQGQPDGVDTENHVVVEVKSKLLHDFNKNEEHCAPCDLKKSLVLTLIGVCMNTYFGNYFLNCNQDIKAALYVLIVRSYLFMHEAYLPIVVVLVQSSH